MLLTFAKNKSLKMVYLALLERIGAMVASDDRFGAFAAGIFSGTTAQRKLLSIERMLSVLPTDLRKLLGNPLQARTLIADVASLLLGSLHAGRSIMVSPKEFIAWSGEISGEYVPFVRELLAAMIGLDNATAVDKSAFSQIDEVATHGANIPVNPDYKDGEMMHQDLVRIQEIISKNGSSTTSKEKLTRGAGSSIIGGCCCVDLSIEYLPSNILSETNCAVALM